MSTKDISGCVGSATLILMASLWIPFVGPFIGLLTPLPFLYYTTKLGLSKGLKLFVLSMFSVGLVGTWTGHPQSILFAAQFSLLGLFLSVLFYRGLGIGRTIALGTVFLLALSSAFLLYAALGRDMGPWELVRAYLGENLKAAFGTYEEMGVPPEHVTAFREYRDGVIRFLLKIFPALTILGTGFAVWINVILALRLFRATELDFPDHFQPDRWRAPENLVWLLLASGFALFLTSGSIQFIALNVLIVVMAVYTFHGLSIIVFFLEKYQMPSWVRVGVYLLLVLQQLFLAVLALAGLFDQWADFRKIGRQPGTDPGEGGE
jgi:uncharacterized protein YybS (DUF2232 family)